MTQPTTAGLRLGAPGVFFAGDRVDRSFQPVRLDVTGFAGVARRGPVDRPVLVRSWSDYQRTFGGLGGSGLLPHAVAAYFSQGGERAYVLRVGAGGDRPAPTDDRTVARFTRGPIELAATGPGAWANGVTVELRLVPTSRFPVLAPDWDTGRRAGPPGDGREIAAPPGVTVPPGSLLRVGQGTATAVPRWVEGVEKREVSPGRRVDVLLLDQPVSRPDPDASGVAPVVASVLTAELVLHDRDPDLSRDERHTGLGLDPAHPRFLPRVVERDSLLVVPIGTWTRARIVDPDPGKFSRVDGREIDASVDESSFFDDRDDVDPDDPAALALRGATGLAQVAELGLLAVPDLFWRWQEREPEPEPEPVPGPARFVRCAAEPPLRPYRTSTATTQLDTRTPGDRAAMQGRQMRLVRLAERARRFVALLDVPAGMAVRDIARWRAGFDCSYAAAYHPWLRVDGGGTVTVPPSAFAAGVIAARELRFGLPWGPANELAATAVGAAAAVSDADQDLLHPLGINVFRAERDGFRLTGARTLSRDPAHRQLSVRRLMTMLRLALDREAQWVMFEPNTPALREQLRHLLIAFLSGLYRAGAFVGGDETEAFFVRVDDDLNPRSSLDLGRLVVEVGVAPAEPLEFIVVRLVRAADGSLGVEEASRG
jgi:hypothetical protein